MVFSKSCRILIKPRFLIFSGTSMNRFTLTITCFAFSFIVSVSDAAILYNEDNMGTFQIQ